MSAPQVYLILGCNGTGRFQVVSDLIEFGAETDDKCVVYHSPSDADEAGSDFHVKSREATIAPFEINEGIISAEVAEDTDLVFIVADGLADPADSIETFHAWLAESSCEIGRVITVLHSELAIGNHDAFRWFDCCIHFSDVILLAKRENVANKDMKKFLDHYTEEFYPCLFEYVKKGRVSNPSLVLETQPRRITRIFDVPEIFEDDDDEDIFEEETAGDLKKDKFLKRGFGNKREIHLPNIADLL